MKVFSIERPNVAIQIFENFFRNLNDGHYFSFHCHGEKRSTLFKKKRETRKMEKLEQSILNPSWTFPWYSSRTSYSTSRLPHRTKYTLLLFSLLLSLLFTYVHVNAIIFGVVDRTHTRNEVCSSLRLSLTVCHAQHIQYNIPAYTALLLRTLCACQSV